MDPAKPRKIHGEGSYALFLKRDHDYCNFSDWTNPWIFHQLFTSSDDVVFKWLRKRGLLATDLPCLTCQNGNRMKLNVRESASDGFSFRCKKSHEAGMRKNSFFQGSPFNVRDLILFIKMYLDVTTLHKIANAVVMDYKHTAVTWASYVRELFCEYVHEVYPTLKLEGDV
jgi:hypothetical protein